RNTFPFQIGIVKIDRAGKVMWKHWDNSHHWPAMGPDGKIYAPYLRTQAKVKHFADRAVETRCANKLDLEGIGIYAPDGTLLKRIDLVEQIAKADYPGLLYGLRDGCDPVHLNSIDIASAAVAVAIPGVNAGDMLVSLRETSTVAILDKDDGHIKRIVSGRTAAQHSPKFLPDGTALVFDNQGGERVQAGDTVVGGTRIVRLNFVTGSSETIFPRAGEAGELPFFSQNAGHIDISPDATRAMVTGKEPGRSFEIDIASGRPLWSYRSGFDIAPYLAREKIKTDTTRAWQRMWGVYYVTDAQFKAAGLGN
ncbi:MAG: arylsulfotransferase family protein, partial [Polymorphobacter sp.]